MAAMPDSVLFRLSGAAVPRFLLAAALLIQLFPAGASARAHLSFAIQEFEPFTFVRDGRVQGAAVECVLAVCGAMDGDCSIESYPWPRAQMLVKVGSMDGLFVLGWNRERAQWLTFSPPLLCTEYGFFAKEGSSLAYSKPQDLAGLTVGVFGPSNSSYTLEQLLKGVPRAAMDMRPDGESGFVKLSLGRVDAVFSNRDVGLAAIKALGLANLRYVGGQGATTYYVAFSKFAAEEDVALFNRTLSALQRDGTIPAILARHGMSPPAVQWDAP